MVRKMVPLAQYGPCRIFMKQTFFDLDAWAEAAPKNQVEFRQAISIILTAVANDRYLSEIMIMKGGILMAIRHSSTRYTSDLDFSSSVARANFDQEKFDRAFRQSLAMIVADSDYGLDCRVQSCRFNPPDDHCHFPNLELKIGYAYKGTPKHKRLMAGQSPSTIEMDFSLNEPINDVEVLRLERGMCLQAYALTDLIAEKFRALLQQQPRNRYRRQDVYDLRFLLESGIDESKKQMIHRHLIMKAKARGIEPNRDSLANPELRRRAEKEYKTLADEIEGDLPDFDESFALIASFYRSLPWSG